MGGVQPVGGYIGDEWDVVTGSFVYSGGFIALSIFEIPYLP